MSPSFVMMTLEKGIRHSLLKKEQVGRESLQAAHAQSIVMYQTQGQLDVSIGFFRFVFLLFARSLDYWNL